MNNEELKKKIVDILQRKLQDCPLQPHGIMYRDVAEYIADALIAAGYGDVKDLQAQVDALEITNIALQAGYYGAEKDRLYWVNKYKEAEHRAEVAEKALKHAVNVYIAHTETYSKKKWWYKYFLREAEKEIAEEGKDENY